MKIFCLFVLIEILYFVSCQTSTPRRREYYLKFTYAQNSTSTILINDQFPGPTLRAELNDIFVIHVENALLLDEELTVHFHGMHFEGTPQMDGVAFLTQMPIARQTNFTYVFKAYPEGTYFYHSHSGLQTLTAFGALIVDNPRRMWRVPEVPSGPLLISDQWTGMDRITAEEGLLSSPFVWMGEPDGLIINGQRNFQMKLQPNRRYLLRLIGAMTLSSVAFSIDQHPMEIVEVDGTLIKPVPNVSSIEIGSGQRYVVMIRTKRQATGVFIIRSEIRWRTIPGNSSVLGILRYGENSVVPTNLSALPQPVLANETEFLNVSWRRPYESLLAADRMPNVQPNQEYFLLNANQRTSDGSGMRWVINNSTLTMSRLMNFTRPILFDVYNGNMDTSLADLTYPMEANEVVDFVFQNTVSLFGMCETHPYHMHGHKFWVHSYGPGLYNASRPNPIKTTTNPVLRDTFQLYATEYEYFTPNLSSANYLKPCGWTKIRVVANNPGIWLFHCHIGAHTLTGMNFIVTDAINQISMTYLPQN